jgi:hypothetical protein
MKRAIALLAMFLVQTCQQAPALAQACTAEQHLQAGAVAPCTGKLWPVSWSAEAVQCVTVDLPRAVSESEAWERIARAPRYCPAPAPIATPWHESPVLWGVSGFLLGAVAVVAVVQAVRP